MKQLMKMDLQTFARQKNAKRLHHIMDYTPGEDTIPSATDEGWLRLAKWITTFGDDTEETTEDEGYYDGDGTPETTVTSVAWGYSPEGTYDAEDPAMALIESKRLLTGEGRKVWHKITMTNGDIYVQRANLSDIVAGEGDAVDYETFSCNIRYDRTPVKTPAATTATTQEG